MNIQSRKELRQTAADHLASAPGNPKMMALVYGGVICGLALLSAFISFYLNNEIAGTGGLANMGLRSALSTIQFILPLVQAVVVMCLELGYHGAALNISRGRGAEPRTLLTGFHRWGAVIRLYLMKVLLYSGAAIVTMYLSSYIFMLLPFSDSFLEIMTPIVTSVSTPEEAITLLDEATLSAAMTALQPMLWIFAGLFCIVVIPLVYQYRMALFCLADSPQPGAMAALRNSRMMMRRNRFALFRLDLGFWWYYLLQLLIAVIAYGDVLLPMVGVTLPMSEEVGYFLFYALSLIVQAAVYYFFLNRIQVTYAAAYDTLRPQPQEPQYPVNT